MRREEFLGNRDAVALLRGLSRRRMAGGGDNSEQTDPLFLAPSPGRSL